MISNVDDIYRQISKNYSDIHIKLRQVIEHDGGALSLQIQNFAINEERILVVGPIYDKTEKLFALNTLYQPNDILVLLGDVCYPYKNTSEVTKRLNELTTFFEGKKSYYILGDHDLIFKSQIATSNADAYDWLHYKLLGVRFTYKNNSSLLVIHGGLLPKHKKLDDLNNDPEVSFITEMGDKQNWHKKYDGRFGYAITSHPVSKNNQIQIYKNSTSLDTQCSKSEILAVQEFTKNGLGQTFYI